MKPSYNSFNIKDPSEMLKVGNKYLILNQGNKVIHHWKSATFGGD